MRTIITYGTFDLLHVGHIRLLQRAYALGDQLIVGLSTDEFNRDMKNKVTVTPYADRCKILMNLRTVSLVIPEFSWDQKPNDIEKYNVAEFVMGDDWKGQFDELEHYCKVTYLPRTGDVSTTLIKNHIGNGINGQIAGSY